MACLAGRDTCYDGHNGQPLVLMCDGVGEEYPFSLWALDIYDA
jgi:hypothetical protein